MVNPSRFNTVSHSRKDLELLADWHPFDNGFRTSFGLVYYHANHKLTKSSSIARVVTTTVRDGNIFSCLFTFWSSCDDIISQSAVTYPWADFGTHSYDVRYRSYGPYLGVGYDTAANAKGWGIIADAGAFYRGSPTVTTSFTCGPSNPIGTPTCDAYQNALSAESDAMKANYPKWMPKFSVGVKYGF